MTFFGFSSFKFLSKEQEFLYSFFFSLTNFIEFKIKIANFRFLSTEKHFSIFKVCLSEPDFFTSISIPIQLVSLFFLQVSINSFKKFNLFLLIYPDIDLEISIFTV
jgi:hypothetical protein